MAAKPYHYTPNPPATGTARREAVLVIDGLEPGQVLPFPLDATILPLGSFEPEGQTLEVRHTDFSRKGKPTRTTVTTKTLPEPELPDPSGTIEEGEPETGAGPGEPAGPETGTEAA